MNALAELSFEDYYANKPLYVWNNFDPLIITVQSAGDVPPENRQVRQVIWSIGQTICDMLDGMFFFEVVAQAYLGDIQINTLSIEIAASRAVEVPQAKTISNDTITASRKRALEAIVPSDFVLECTWGTNPREIVDGQVLAFVILQLLMVDIPEQSPQRRVYKTIFSASGVFGYIRDLRGTQRRARMLVKQTTWTLLLLAEEYLRLEHHETLRGRSVWSGEDISSVNVDTVGLAVE